MPAAATSSLTHAGWQVQPGENHRTTFYVGPDWETTAAVVTIRLRPAAR